MAESSGLRGVIAAVATPISSEGEPDLDRFVALARWLLDRGCDGLNVCGTTGEATSLSVAQRMAVMDAASRDLPLQRLMVGTGAAALGDAIALTRHAADLGFAAALVLPPFYYKEVEADGLLRYFDRLVGATAQRPIQIYLYNFPALSGVPFAPALVRSLREMFGSRIAGLKDSSGDLAYAREITAIDPDLRVFPSNEAVLLDARAGAFAGCISASANINSEFCGRAFRAGDTEALERAKRIRGLLSGRSLIASVKAVLAARFDDPAYERLLPPLTPLPERHRAKLVDEVLALLD